MHITSFGCSFTFGTELSDDNGNLLCPNPSKLTWPAASKLTWPALIAHAVGTTYLCAAQGGLGNLTILDRVMIHCSIRPADLLIINWTFADRFDYSDPDGRHFDNGVNDYLTARPGESDPVSDFYFRNMHSERRDKITNLIYIKTVIDHLIDADVKFLMTSIDSTLFCQRWHAPSHVVKLQDAIRPYIHDFEGKNFLDWSRHRGFPITAAGHPLEEAHAAAAELMLPNVKQILEPGVNKK